MMCCISFIACRQNHTSSFLRRNKIQIIYKGSNAVMISHTGRNSKIQHQIAFSLLGKTNHKISCRNQIFFCISRCFFRYKPKLFQTICCLAKLYHQNFRIGCDSCKIFLFYLVSCCQSRHKCSMSNFICCRYDFQRIFALQSLINLVSKINLPKGNSIESFSLCTLIPDS